MASQALPHAGSSRLDEHRPPPITCNPSSPGSPPSHPNPNQAPARTNTARTGAVAIVAINGATLSGASGPLAAAGKPAPKPALGPQPPAGPLQQALSRRLRAAGPSDAALPGAPHPVAASRADSGSGGGGGSESEGYWASSSGGGNNNSRGGSAATSAQSSRRPSHDPQHLGELQQQPGGALAVAAAATGEGPLTKAMARMRGGT